MLEKNFQKKTENFDCQYCGKPVVGNGYTNHCPHCLWSKHVDIKPGDRKSVCHGMMEPVDLEKRGDVFYIVHKCKICDHKKLNKAVPGDSFNKLIEISSKNK